MSARLLLALLVASAAAPALAAQSDTLRLEVGSKEVDGRVYQPHLARVRVRVGEGEGRQVAEWTNELTLGDSAGRPVMRWVTKGSRTQPSGETITWELRQTYDAITLAPYGYEASSSAGGYTRLKLNGRQVAGVRRAPGASADQPVDLTIDRPGFMASASDLVPLAAGLKEGAVMIAPVWSPAMTNSELRIFTVLGKVRVDVEGTDVEAWKVEERRNADRGLTATWYLTETSPYMVYGEVPLPNGQVQRMSEVALPMPKR
jgi:hypothetical protein